MNDQIRKKIKKISFYICGGLRYATPDYFFRRRLPSILRTIDRYDREELVERVNYYLKSDQAIEQSDQALRRGELPFHHSFYYFDLQYILSFFPSTFRFDYLFGDVNETPPFHSFVKSRPICESNERSVLLKLDRVRHYLRIRDSISYRNKKNMLVWRGVANQQHRIEFCERFHDHPLCDVGLTAQSLTKQPGPIIKPTMSIAQQLQCKFILSLEGNDVATNVKWIMQSNSLCMMKRPKFETWFMEGKLVPSVHYVELKDDYSDLEEKIDYYSSNPDEAEVIIKNAKAYVANFFNKPKELLLSILVAMKYFRLSGQCQCDSPLD